MHNKILKPDEEFRRGLEEALTIVENEISRLGEFPLAWQSLATQLNKVLCEKSRRAALFPRVVPDPKLHPMGNEIKPKRNLFALGYHVEFGPGRVRLSCFDESAARIPLDDWLEQIMFVSSREDFTVRDVIHLARNREGTHFDKHEHVKFEALKSAHTFVVAGEKLDPLPIALAVIGAYVAPQVRSMMQPNKSQQEERR